MRRTPVTWLAFAACLAVVLAAMAWISVTAVRLDRSERRANRQADAEEKIRLALWRMDSALMPLIAQESARPYYVYSAFHGVGAVTGGPISQPAAAEPLLPSPLLAFASPHVFVHFQFAPDGELTSPQVPTGSQLRLALSGLTTREQIDAAAERFARLRAGLDPKAVLALLPEPPALAAATSQPAGGQDPSRARLDARQAADLQQLSAQRAQRDLARADSRRMLNTSEWTARNMLAQQAQANQMDLTSALLLPPTVSQGELKACWIGDLLLLARRVQVGERRYVQGCWLNWPAIRAWLVEGAADLLPAARLAPAAGDPTARPGETYRLAALPVRLLPGPVPQDAEPPRSPVVLSLLVAWACILLGAAAVAVLLGKAVALSDRRGAFVSAVTHELRTPLTTFRLYADMLAEGMVTDEAKRTSYLRRLRDEADRLGHLVENVLAYARLSGPRSAAAMETLSLGQLIDRSRERLAALAERAAMQLVADEADAAARETRVRCNASAVEQVLLNLVDNACKYAGRAADRRIHLQAARRDGEALLQVRDHGPGIAPAEARRLFQAFRKSAHDAAHSAPGIGLGLALSRRLARDMRGDLTCQRPPDGGACFTLTLPIDALA